MGGSSGSNGSVAILDVQNALKVLEKNCTNSDKMYICKRLKQTASAIVLLLLQKSIMDENSSVSGQNLQGFIHAGSC